MRGGSEEFVTAIGRKARENPLQTVVIGAGLAYPLWGLLKTIPMPIMLMGAGLWLSKQKSGATGASLAEDLGAKAANLGTEGLNRIADSVRLAGNTLSAGVSAVTDAVTSTAQNLRNSIAETGQAAVDSVTDAATDVKNSVSAMASDVATKATDVGQQSRSAFLDVVDRNPILVAGVGLAVGAFIAASLPTTEAENQAFGQRSDDLKVKARDAVAHGVEQAKDVAAGMVGDVASAAARDGLSAEGLSKAVRDLTGGVKSVVDRGLKTALGGETSPHSTNSNLSQQQLGNGDVG